MALTKPSITEAKAGEPITSQAWNEIVGGLNDLFDAVLAIGTGLVEVEVVENGAMVRGAVVVAEPLGEGNPVVAVPPFAGRTAHSIVGVSSGPWRLHIARDGYQTETRDVEVPLDDRLIVEVSRVGPALPDLFGLGATDAVKKLSKAGISIERLIDTTGNEISPFAIDVDQAKSPVLMQFPAAGTSMLSGLRVRLVIAASIRETKTVTMPNLAGRSFGDVLTILDELGLRIGETQTLTTG